MGSDFANDVIAALGRSHFCFWLRGYPRQDHSIPGKLVLAIMFLLIALMTLTGRGTTAVASAIYSVYFVMALCLAVFIVFIRVRRVARDQVTVLIEAYVVALFITVLLLSHNLFFPIKYFSIDTGVPRGQWVQLRIACLYAAPAALYLSIQSWRLVDWRTKSGVRFITHAGHVARLNKIQIQIKIEILIWSIFHYLVIVLMVWSILFTHNEQVDVLNNAIKSIKLLPTN
jgi:uncharacterized membrane protein